MTTAFQSRPGAARAGRHVGAGATIFGSVLAFTGAFLFRFLTADFTNDHFVHLSRGQQIVMGELPIRDFFDPGLFGQYFASAAVLTWSGHNLYGEALLTIAFIAAGATIGFFAAARLSRSFWIAAAATLLVVMSTPRLYSYPKAFFYVWGIASAWTYASHPSRRHLLILAAVTVGAFLFRHDHGIYIGLGVVGALLPILFWSEPRRLVAAFSTYAAACIVLMLPFLIFVQLSSGLFRYIGGLAPQIDQVSTIRFNWLPVTFDGSAPWLTVSPAPERRVNIRWADTMNDAARRAKESAYGLTRGEVVEKPTWSYVPTNERRENLRRLVDDPGVADTHGIDRARATLEISEPFYARVSRWVPLFRMHLAPGIFSETNALAWFYYLTLVLPFIGVAMLARLLWKGEVDRAEAAVAGMAALMCFIVVQTLVRGSPDSRMADVAGPTSVLGAWLVTRWVRSSARVPRWQGWRAAAALAFLFVCLWSVGTGAYAGRRLDASRMLTGPAGMAWQWGVISDRLRARPIENWGRADRGVPGLGRYVFECTKPSDRVLITWFQPEIFFYAERAFAGGQVYLQPRWHASIPDQQLTVERMTREHVPIVLVKNDRNFAPYFPLVSRYVQEHYVRVPVSSHQIDGYGVMVDKRIAPTGRYDQLGLPCYR